jgi:hypothetical protein
MKKIYVGIDISKDDFIVVYWSTDEIIKTINYENSSKGIKDRVINNNNLLHVYLERYVSFLIKSASLSNGYAPGKIHGEKLIG